MPDRTSGAAGSEREESFLMRNQFDRLRLRAEGGHRPPIPSTTLTAR